MPFSTRILHGTDTHALRALLAVFGHAFEDEQTYCARQPDDDYLCRLLAGDSFVAVVAEQDGVVVGGLAAYELKKFEQARSELYIYDLAVMEHCRRCGSAARRVGNVCAG